MNTSDPTEAQRVQDIAAAVLQRWLTDHGYGAPLPTAAPILAELEQLRHDPRDHITGRAGPVSAWREAMTVAMQVVERHGTAAR